MGTLGIIGGIAPESTIDYYRRLLAAYRVARAEDPCLHVLINSIDLNRLLALAGGGRLEELTDYLAAEVSALARAGAEVALFASNTPHLVFDAVQQRSAIPLISIVEATCTQAEADGLGRLGLLGTRFTMQARFYPEAFAKRGIAIVPPDPEEQEFIHSRYMGELVGGVFRPETRERVTAIIDTMIRREGLDGVILAGTELPLLIPAKTSLGVPLLDTTGIHVDAAIAHLLA
jgi:aspartate racemase